MPLPAPDVTYIRWLADLGLDDIPLVGGKNASLGELARALSPMGVRVSPGFAITADAYRRFLREAREAQTVQDSQQRADIDMRDAPGAADRRGSYRYH